MHFIKLSSLIVLSMCSVNSFAQQTKIVVKKGEKYKVESTTKMTSTAEVMGQTMENNADNKMTTLYEVADVEPAEIKLEAVVTNVKFESSAMGQVTSYDSDKKDNEGPVSEMFAGLVNKKNTVKLDANGSITKQDAPEQNVAAMMGGMGNESTIELFIPSLIGKELKTGDNYPDVNEVKSDKMTSRDSGSYKVTAIENGIASISYSGTRVSAVQMEQMGMSMTKNSTDNVKSELQIDTRTGRVLARASVIDSNISIDAGGMNIPATAKTIITITVSAVN